MMCKADAVAWRCFSCKDQEVHLAVQIYVSGTRHIEICQQGMLLLKECLDNIVSKGSFTYAGRRRRARPGLGAVILVGARGGAAELCWVQLIVPASQPGLLHLPLLLASFPGVWPALQLRLLRPARLLRAEGRHRRGTATTGVGGRPPHVRHGSERASFAAHSQCAEQLRVGCAGGVVLRCARFGAPLWRIHLAAGTAVALEGWGHEQPGDFLAGGGRAVRARAAQRKSTRCAIASTCSCYNTTSHCIRVLLPDLFLHLICSIYGACLRSVSVSSAT